MSDDQLGVLASVAIALGGMIGGGIFAVLGVVAQITGPATWAAFVVAGVVAMAAAYSFTALNAITEDRGGSVTFVQSVTGNTTLAGVVGWTLLVGYLGSMGMYAYAFGSYTVGFAVVPVAVAGLPTRPLVSVLVVALFTGLNAVGARATGTVENLLVGAKVSILLVMGVGGLVYGTTTGALTVGLAELWPLSLGPVTGAAVSFVAFQGWQLLFYDQERVSDPQATIRKAVFLAIPAAVGIYVVVAVTTLSLAPADVVRTHPERALAAAADPFLPAGYLLISVAALFSTGSALNATLFSSGYLAKGMLSADLLPDRVGSASASGVPRRTLVGLGAVTAIAAAVGTLGAITAFASLAFIGVFGGVSALALTKRDHDEVWTPIPALGVVGTATFLPLMLWHLASREPGTFGTVVVVAVALLAAELIYFERAHLAEEIAVVEDAVREELPNNSPEGEE